MKGKIFFITFWVLLAFFLFWPKGGYSQDLGNGKVASVEQGQEAPFKGILLDPVAYSKIVVQAEYEKSKEILKLKEEMERDKLKHKLEIQSYKDQISLLKESHKISQKRDEEEITFLRQYALKDPTGNNNNKKFWKGFGTGSVTILAIVGGIYLVKSIE